MVAVEKSRALATESLPALLGGGRQWRLVFTSSAADLASLRKGGAGGGKFFPVTAVQSWAPPSSDAEGDGHITNGVYLGHWASLRFDGPFRLSGKRLAFDFSQISLRLLGLRGSFSLKPTDYVLPTAHKTEGKLPFFLFAYADGELVVARGRSGGLAMWAAATPSWLLEKGVVVN